jgi:hypothetical protein
MMPDKSINETSVRSGFPTNRAGSRIALTQKVSSDEVEVEIVLDEDELFEIPRSGYRIKTARNLSVSTQAFAPSEGVLEAMRGDDDDEVTRRVSLDEVRRRLSAGGRK